MKSRPLLWNDLLGLRFEENKQLKDLQTEVKREFESEISLGDLKFRHWFSPILRPSTVRKLWGLWKKKELPQSNGSADTANLTTEWEGEAMEKAGKKQLYERCAGY